MTTANFVDQSTVIEADWLNDTDAVVYDVLDSPTTAAEARTALDIASPINVAWHGATGDGTTDDTTAVQAAIDAAEDGGAIYFPETDDHYAVGNLSIKRPLTVFGDSSRTLIKPVSGTTGYLFNIDGSLSGAVLSYENHIQGVAFRDIGLEGSLRVEDCGAFYLKRLEQFTFCNVSVENFTRESYNCYASVREGKWIGGHARYCGNKTAGTSYPSVNLEHQENVGEAHNNLLFIGFFNVYPLGDHFWYDTIAAATTVVRKIRHTDCLYHGIVSTIDGSGNNPFNATWTTEQKTTQHQRIRSCNDVTFQNTRNFVKGDGVASILLEAGSNTANPDPANIRIFGGEVSAVYTDSGTRVGVDVDDGDITIDGVITDGMATNWIQAAAGTTVRYGLNNSIVGGGAPSLSGTTQIDTYSDIDIHAKSIVNAKGIDGINSIPLDFIGKQDSVVNSMRWYTPNGSGVDTERMRLESGDASSTLGTELALLSNVYLKFNEMAFAAAGTADQAKVYARDNGGGKTQLVVQFGTGVAIVIATEA